MSRRVDALDALGCTGAFLFIFCLYTSPATLWPWTEVFRPALLAATLMLAALVLRRVVRAEPIPLAGGVGASMLVVFALVFLSRFWALAPSRSAAFFLDTSKLLLAFLGLCAVLDSPRRIRQAMTLAVLVAMVPAQGTIERWRGGIELVEGFRGAWIGLLANPNQLAMVMAVTVPWALVLWTRSRGLMKLVALVSFGLCAATVVVTHSRGGALGLAVGVGVWALLSTHRVKAWTLTLAALAAVLVFAPESFWKRTETISTYEQDASARGRLQSWEAGARAFSSSPLLGIGADNYLEAWNRFMPRNVREHSYTAHNTWMQVVVELGLLGITAFALMLLAAVRGLWQARHGELGEEARAMLASIAAIVVCGSTGGYAFNWFFYLVLGLSGAVLVEHRRSLRKERALERFALA